MHDAPNNGELQKSVLISYSMSSNSANPLSSTITVLLLRHIVCYHFIVVLLCALAIFRVVLGRTILEIPFIGWYMMSGY